MAFDDNTQATQPYTDPRRLGLTSSRISKDDRSDVICILQPSTSGAHEAVKATMQHGVQHIVPNADLLDNTDVSDVDSEFGIHNETRAIALRMSSSVRNLSMGFVFGRKPELCDVTLTSKTDTTVSSRHFRIYVTDHGILMLQDTSTNGTGVDDVVLKHKSPAMNTSHHLANGSIISVGLPRGEEIKFILRLPDRGDEQKMYDARLKNYVASLPGAKPGHLPGTPGNSYGMHWNGGSNYSVVGRLGEGAFATVYQLANRKDGQLFAAKELDKTKFLKNGVIDIKFDNEIQIMRRLRHPNIVQYIDYHEYDQWVYIIMEVVPLGELSKHAQRQRGILSEPVVQQVALQVLRALEYLHAQGITHRDIKPDNILVAETEPFTVKLSDFGLSKCVTDHETFLKTFCGTLLYCAPEIYPNYAVYDSVSGTKRTRLGAPSRKQYDNRVDMWSFGAVLFHILCNKPPFTAKSDQDDKPNAMLNNIMTQVVNFHPLHRVGVSEQGIDFISTLLQRSPAARPEPKKCLKHKWLTSVAKEGEHMDLEQEMPVQYNQGLSVINEADEEEPITWSQVAQREAEEGPTWDQASFPDQALEEEIEPFGYPILPVERTPKRQRHTSINGPEEVFDDADGESNLGGFEQSPQVEPPGANAGAERLFGEITPSLLKSSGVFGKGADVTSDNSPPGAEPSLRHGIEGISFNDWTTTDMENQSTSESEHSQPARASERPGDTSAGAKSTAPSLLGAEAGIGNLNMASPEGAHSETSSQPQNPATPVTRQLTPTSTHLSESDSAIPRNGDGSQVIAETVVDRYIDIGIPENMKNDEKYVESHHAIQTANKKRRAENSKAKTFSGEDQPKGGATDITIIINGKRGAGETQIARRVHVPPLESLQPSLMPPPDGFARPGRRFGKITTTPGSVVDTTAYLESHMTWWGRSDQCTSQYADKDDFRVPKQAIQICFHGVGIEKLIAKGEPWWTADGIYTVVATRASRCILVNGVELRKESTKEHCAYYGKIYTGDIITVFPTTEQQGPFLKFHVEINYGDSARRRPENEKGFQIRKELVHHRRDLQRRASVKSMKVQSKEPSPDSLAVTNAS